MAAIYLKKFETAIGEMLAGATDSALCLMEFTNRNELSSELTDLQKYLKCEAVSSENDIVNDAVKQMNEYFSGNLREFNLPLMYPGSEFQVKCWNELLKIPYGTTISYREQALGLGSKKYTRAVGKANGSNRISIIIPCHRVIGSDGKLTGYGGGIQRKSYLLDLEKDYLLNQ